MKIVITGCAGFIGSNFARWLLNCTNEITVIGIDNYSTGYGANMPDFSDRFKCYRADICSKYTIENIFNFSKPDVCYHFAAYAAEGRSNYIRNHIHSNNTVGSANVINACVNNKCKLIFTSSVAVYSGVAPFFESTIPNPIDEYGLSKWATEKSIQIAGDQQGLDWCIIRPRNVFGERQSLWDKSRNVFGIWMHQILHNEPMTIYGDGRNRRSFTYIEDILACLYNAMMVEKETINLGSRMSYTIKEANEILQTITGYDKVIYTEPRHEVPEAYCGVTKSIDMLGYGGGYPLDLGLEKMWEWAKHQPDKPLVSPPMLEIHQIKHSSIT